MASPALRVFLVGFMGAGKTTTGRELAPLLSALFVDLDDQIEAACALAIPEIFRLRGESVFRGEETRQLTRIGRFPRVVVATGGGTCVGESNLTIMRSLGVSVFLDVPWEEILRRLPGKRDERPLFDAPEQAMTLYSARLPHYHQADMTVRPLPGESPASIARRIAAVLGVRA